MKKLQFVSIWLLAIISCSNNLQIETPISKITSAAVFQESNYTDRGNNNEVILKIAVARSENKAVDLKNIVMNSDGTTNINDVESIKIYNTNRINILDPNNPQTVLLDSAVPTTGNITINTTGQLNNTYMVFINLSLS
jgi:sialidase-1